MFNLLYFLLLKSKYSLVRGRLNDAVNRLPKAVFYVN